MTAQLALFNLPQQSSERTYSVEQWEALTPWTRKTIIADTRGKAKFIPQKSSKIDWAAWSWNPVTGCEHGCRYCYARDIAEHTYPEGFEPTFRPDRLVAPARMRMPDCDVDDPERRVFVVSMGELFGDWVPTDWIEAVLSVIKANPQWTFLLLTKNPKRYAEFSPLPKNAWAGATVDCQSRVAPTERAFEDIDASVKWLSVEPMFEPLTFSRLEIFDWLAIGGASRTDRTPGWKVPADRWGPLEDQALRLGLRVHRKESLEPRWEVF